MVCMRRMALFQPIWQIKLGFPNMLCHYCLHPFSGNMAAWLSGEKINMKCVICKTGETEIGETTVTLQRGDVTVVIKHVPAEICLNCGEYYLSESITDRVMAQAESAVERNAEVEILRFAA